MTRSTHLPPRPSVRVHVGLALESREVPEEGQEERIALRGRIAEPTRFEDHPRDLSGGTRKRCALSHRSGTARSSSSPTN